MLQWQHRNHDKACQRADRGLFTLGFKLGLIGSVTLAVHIAISALFGLEEAQVVIRRGAKIILKPIRVQ